MTDNVKRALIYTVPATLALGFLINNVMTLFLIFMLVATVGTWAAILTITTDWNHEKFFKQYQEAIKTFMKIHNLKMADVYKSYFITFAMLVYLQPIWGIIWLIAAIPVLAGYLLGKKD
jgi:hypothetical protein